jgi:hypothetical protein
VQLLKTPVREANDHIVMALRALDRSNCPADVALAASLERLLRRVEARLKELSEAA